MNKTLIAKATIVINSPISKVWDAFINPEVIRLYMFGTKVVSDWKAGSPILWTGEWQGKSYEDKGVIKKIEKESLLSYTHFSPLSGKPDIPENYHTIIIELSGSPAGTSVVLTQDGNSTEAAREHSEKNWKSVLEALKKLLEN